MPDPNPTTTPAAPSGDLTAATDGNSDARRADPQPAAPSGDAPMSDVQRTTLQTLSEAAGVSFDPALTTAAAARRITELQRAKDRATEAGRAARGTPTEAIPPAAGEEDPGAALDAPGTKQAIQGEERATGPGKPAAR